jgi:hypothetical protein
VDRQPRAALLTWGVHDLMVDRIADPGRALTFYTLVRNLRASFTAQGVPENSVLAASSAAAKLVSASLDEGSPRLDP